MFKKEVYLDLLSAPFLCCFLKEKYRIYRGSDFVRLTYEAVIMQLFKMLRHHSGFSLFLDDSLRI